LSPAASPPGVELAHYPGGENVLHGDDGGRGRIEGEEMGRRLPTRLHVVLGADQVAGVELEPGVFKAFYEPGGPLVAADRAFRPGDQCQPLVALCGQVLDRSPGP